VQIKFHLNDNIESSCIMQFQLNAIQFNSNQFELDLVQQNYEKAHLDLLFHINVDGLVKGVMYLWNAFIIVKLMTTIKPYTCFT